MLTPVNRTFVLDPVLNQEIVHVDEGEAVVIGVTSVQAQRFYMVDIADVGIVWVTWDPYYL